MIADPRKVPSPRELLNLLLGSSPTYLAGSFRTESQDDSKEVYESGTFRYFEDDYWDVTFSYGERWVLAPDRMAVISRDGRKEQVFGRRAKRLRPPWSHVQPRMSGLLGQNAGDDWQLNASEPFVADQAGLHAKLVNLQNPKYSANILIDRQLWCIVEVELPHERQLISIDRTVTTDDAQKELAALKEILDLG